LSFQSKSALEFSWRVILNPEGFMKIQDIVMEIDAEISRLQQVNLGATVSGRKIPDPARALLRGNAIFEVRQRRFLRAVLIFRTSGLA